MRVSGKKSVPARADPARGEHAEPVPGPLGPLEPSHRRLLASAPLAQVPGASKTAKNWNQLQKNKNTKN